MIAELSKALHQYWGYNSFLPLQEEAIQSVMEDRDSVVILPTGGGKSLCYQLPAACRDGLAVVVSPLIALMKDQVDGLRACGIATAAVHSGVAVHEKLDIAARIAHGELRLLYLSPERLLTSKTLDFLARQRLSFFAVDEAHCISAWGHDFRPEYRGLSILRQRFPAVSLHAYTATATPRVREDIVQQLQLRDPRILVGSFHRGNLIYRAARRSRLRQQGTAVLDRYRGQSGIIYCISRAETEELSESLRQQGYSAVAYHAGLTDQERAQRQDAFIREQVDTIVATIAFGMGIDKSNVRYVIHAGMPKSL
ncbi:MAG TPA: RecQ family ATP-dependent DNA helicase, partial [Pirellulaceae bacterium]